MSDLFSGVASSLKSVANNVASSINSSEVRKIAEKMQDVLMNYSEEELTVRDATNEDPWGPTGPQMKKISDYTFNSDSFHPAVGMLYKRIEGSSFFELRSLENYKFIDEKGHDQGINIRHRVKIIIDLLTDDDKLREERQKAKADNKSRYRGYTSDDLRSANFDNHSSSSGTISSAGRSREVSSFQFRDSNRDSSPELGFDTAKKEETKKKTENDDDEFGDFIAARTTNTPKRPSLTNTTSASFSALPPPPKTGSLAHVPAPKAAQASSGGSFFDDLISIDTSKQQTFSPAPANLASPPQADIFGVTPPASSKPSGNTFDPFASAGGSNSNVDLFGGSSAPINQSSVSPAAPMPDMFSGFAGQANNSASADLFGDFGATPTPAPLPTNDFFGNTSSSAIPPAAFSDLFGLTQLTPSSQKSVGNAQNGSNAVSAKQENKPAPKVGNTWANAGGLIDFDNLANKPTNTKAAPSLNQLQNKF
ncbi:unnamed protein product [Caenorhabditis auriculariae]|uniref:ENTH domain-containing protein n=1 Tax=Caenorhabditis auriculariae TaxID=2777116 RepID=A0A8S1GY25_9PELO|nr:unnamed protein product [Caenorhabditis auriculariae]